MGAEDKAALKEMIEKYNVEFNTQNVEFNTQTTPSGSDGSVLVDIKKLFIGDKRICKLHCYRP